MKQLPTAPERAEASTPSEPLRQQLDELENLLRTSDFRARKVFSSMEAHLEALLRGSPEYATFARHMQEYSFERALQALSPLKEALNNLPKEAP